MSRLNSRRDGDLSTFHCCFFISLGVWVPWSVPPTSFPYPIFSRQHDERRKEMEKECRGFMARATPIPKLGLFPSSDWQ